MIHCSDSIQWSRHIDWMRREIRWSKKCVRTQSIGIIYTSSLNRNVGHMLAEFGSEIGRKSSMKWNNRSHRRHRHIKTIFDNFADIRFIFLVLKIDHNTKENGILLIAIHVKVMNKRWYNSLNFFLIFTKIHSIKSIDIFAEFVQFSKHKKMTPAFVN